MSISIEEATEIINEDVKRKYGKVVEFEILRAIYYDDFEQWNVNGNFIYEITNKTLQVVFNYTVRDDKVIISRTFHPQ